MNVRIQPIGNSIMKRAGSILVVLAVLTASVLGPISVARAADPPEHVLAEAAAGAADHETHGPASPLDFKSDLAIWTAVLFLLLFLVLRKFAWKPIAAALDAREHHIAEGISAAERANAEGRRLLAEYQAKLATAHEEVRAILDEARRDAEHTQQEILARARAEAEIERNRAKAEIELAASQALKDIAHRSADLAVNLAGKIVRAQLTAADHARLIEESLAGFADGDPRRN
jgi:F-type H+-transporting ATPase subunit b